MSFKASSDIPLITKGDLHALNELVRPSPIGERGARSSARPLDDLKSHHRRWMDRRFGREMKASHYVVLSAIVARTFAWNKPIEVIPLSVFTHGVLDPKNPQQHRLDEDGLPIFAGTGLNVSTVRTALEALSSNRLIERFQVLGAERNTHAYLPVSGFTLVMALSSSAPETISDIPDRIMTHIKATPAVTPLEEAFQAHWTPALDRYRRQHDAA